MTPNKPQGGLMKQTDGRTRSYDVSHSNAPTPDRPPVVYSFKHARSPPAPRPLLFRSARFCPAYFVLTPFPLAGNGAPLIISKIQLSAQGTPRSRLMDVTGECQWGGAGCTHYAVFTRYQSTPPHTTHTHYYYSTLQLTAL